MACIFGAACQPLQPADYSTGAETTPDVTHSPIEGTGSDAGNTAPGTAWITGSSSYAGRETPLIALLVPLSGRQEAVGTAIRDGFVAAWLDTPASRRYRTLIIDEARVAPAAAYREAMEAGARALVGPLLKESVQSIADLAGPLPVLALNTIPNGGPGVPGTVWQFGLAPEDEAAAIATRALALGQRRALALLPASDWGRRLLAAFTERFVDGGGVILDSRTYLPDATDHSGVIRSLLMTTEPRRAANPGEVASSGPGRRQDADLIFVATNGSNGRQIMPQLKFFGAADLPTYSTSSIWEDGSSNAVDLNGVVFPDSPWVIGPDGRVAQLKAGLVRHWGKPALRASRFYALGHDAYRLVPDVLGQPTPGPFAGGEVAGATGTLYADWEGRIHRRLGFAEIRGGQAVSLPDAAELGFPAGDFPTSTPLP